MLTSARTCAHLGLALLAFAVFQAPAAALARDHVVFTNKCNSRVRLFVRVADSQGYANFGWWVFNTGEANKVLSYEGRTLLHDHSKALYFYAEGLGNNLVWNKGPTTTTYNGESYTLTRIDDTDDDNDTPVLLTCSGH